MRKTEFLQELEEELQGEVSAAVIRDNVNYYNQYISQETSKGRSEEDVIDEIGSPRLIARTIIDSRAAGGSEGAYNEGGSRENTVSYDDSGNYSDSGSRFHYIDLSKWYWKLIAAAVMIFIIYAVFTIVGGIFTLLLRYAFPLIVIWLVFSVIKGMRK